jgi:hypothetical protein
MRHNATIFSRVVVASALFLTTSLQGPAREKTRSTADLDPTPPPKPTAGKATSAPAPVQDAAGSIAVYASAEVSQRDVFGQLSDFSTRAALLSKAVRIRDRVWGVLGVRRARPPEAMQIQILLTPEKTPDAGEVELVKVHGGRAVRLRFPETENGEAARFKRSLVVAIVKELMARPVPRTSVYPEEKSVPRWLVDALLHQERCPDVIQFSDELTDLEGQDPAFLSIRDLVARPEQNAKPSSRGEILAARCFLSLLEVGLQKNNSVLEWLQSDPVHMPLASWNRFFASIAGNEEDIHKAWLVHVAALRTQRTRVSMTRTETENDLQRLLEIDVVLPGNVRHRTSLENFEEYVRLPGIESLLQARRLEFLALAAKGHFLFEPVILAYADLCAEISAHRTKRLKERFRSVRSEWEGVRQRLDKLRDYLNWWESLPRSSEPAPELKEFYRELEGADEFRERVSKALDSWEKRLEQNGRRADWKRILEEVDERSRRKLPE